MQAPIIWLTRWTSIHMDILINVSLDHLVHLLTSKKKRKIKISTKTALPRPHDWRVETVEVDFVILKGCQTTRSDIQDSFAHSRNSLSPLLILNFLTLTVTHTLLTLPHPTLISFSLTEKKMREIKEGRRKWKNSKAYLVVCCFSREKPYCTASKPLQKAIAATWSPKYRW